MTRGLDDLGGRRLLGELAAVHDEDRVGDLVEDRDVVGDHGHALHEAAVPELDEHLRDRLLRRDVERRGDLVGDQERRVEQRRDDHHRPLLHAARELDRIEAEHAGIESDELEPPQELRLQRPVVEAAGLEELLEHPADPPRRVERAHRVLRDDRDPGEAVLVHRLEVPDRERRSVELDRAADVLHATREVHEAVPEARLPAPGLAGDAHDLAVRDREGDVVDRANVAAHGAVVHLQVGDVEAHPYMLRSRGLKTSSSPTFIT